ncbi:MAG: DUF4886 domain-containing protein, partial [Clostridia bacterium]|nr:DUF4886 domain-containing protein [Clostridia bacterium]
MKKLSLWLMGILTICLSLICAACSSCNKEKDAVSISETAITLDVGATHTLTATTNVKDGVTWSTSDETVAMVDSGVVTAISAGTATITVTAGKATATCNVTVNEVQEYAELTVDKTIVELKEGGASVSVTATFTVNDEVRDCALTWTSENPEIATVENGEITPVGVGSTIITVSVVYKGEDYIADVNVMVKPDEQIQVSKGSINLALAEVGGAVVSDTFTATAYKAGVENTEATLEFASNNEDIAIVTVENGVATVTSVGEGTCTISVFYTSTNGKIETIVQVTVTRPTLVLDQIIEIPYVADGTVLDVSGLDLQGTLESVYFGDEKVGGEDGVLDTEFVEKNKGFIIPVEIRTNILKYEMELLIAIPYMAEPKQETASFELVDMPTFDGDATTLGFPEGTEIAYELTIGENAGAEGWTNRMIINAAPDKDVVVFDVIVTSIASLDFRFTMWPAKNVVETQGSYGVSAKTVDPSTDADWNRKIFVLGADGKQPSVFATETLYTIYFFVNKGESHVHFSTFTTGIVHVANIRCLDAGEIENDPTLPPPPISQGEEHNPMPTFDGDVTTLGFEVGTVVYQIDGPQSNASDVKLVAQIDSSGDVMYAKLDFVLSAAANSLGLWITAKNSHLGYYTVSPTGVTADVVVDPTREIFVTDANGTRVDSFNANTMYTLYVKLDGREATIQLTTWADLTIYVANVKCVTADEVPFTPPAPPIDGKELSVLFIGNSFSDDTEAYIVDMLLHLGYTNINVGNLYIGGCEIDTHYYNITNDVRAYDFRMRSHNGSKFTEYETITVGNQKQSIAFAIAYKNWDIISVQQASGVSGKADTYNNLEALVAEVQKQATNPDVEIVFNMTWAYQANSTHAQFPDYDSDQMTMYNAIVSAVQEKVTYTVIPNGTAIQNARTSLLGDNLTRDGYHLDLKIGRYIAGLTFVAKVTGEDIANFGYAPNGVTSKQKEIAIESVQNALEKPFEVTQSQVKEDVVEEKDVMPGGSNADAVKEYDGDVTALGFAEGTTVFEYVGVNSDTDKASIKVDSVNYDYVEVQFVITAGDGYFFMHGLKEGNWYNSGISYIVDPSWIRLGDGNNTVSDRRIEVLDADGNNVTSLMSKNVLYTLRVFIRVGELDEIRISKNGSTIYFANVTHGLEADLPVEGPIKQGSGQAALPTYTGDVTTHGFTADNFVQYMTTETSSNVWGADPVSGKTREQLAARIPGESGKYVTIKFAMSEDVASGSVFYVWGLLGSSHTVNGGLNFTTTTHGQILDVNGYPVTSITKNTVYVLEFYIAGTDTYKVSNLVSTGMELYFAPDSITYSDVSIKVEPPIVDDGDDMEDAPILSGETTSTALSVYDGSVTDLGFESGTTVYQLVSVDAWNDRVKIAADPNCKYLDVQFIVSKGAWYFNVWLCNANGMLDGSYLVAELGGGTEHATFGVGFAKHTPNTGANGGNTRIQVLDADGNVVIGGRTNGTIYTLRVWLEDEGVTEVQIGQDNVTMYFANIESTDKEPVKMITQGDGATTLPTYTGDVTTHGFAAGTLVQYMTTETSSNVWGADPVSGKTREQL